MFGALLEVKVWLFFVLTYFCAFEKILRFEFHSNKFALASVLMRIACYEQLISTYSNDKLLRGHFSFSGLDSNGAPW